MRVRFLPNHKWRFRFDIINFASPFICWLSVWSFLEKNIGINLGYYGLLLYLVSLLIHYKWLFQFYNYLSSYCYTRISLGIPFSFDEIKKISSIIENDFDPEPVKYISDLPSDEKKQAFYSYLSEYLEYTK